MAKPFFFDSCERPINASDYVNENSNSARNLKNLTYSKTPFTLKRGNPLQGHLLKSRKQLFDRDVTRHRPHNAPAT